MKNKYKKKSLIFFAISLPLMFVSPVLVNIGFKVLAKDDTYTYLIISVNIALLTMGLAALAVRYAMKYLFSD
ncbi:MAG: hypothetical protein HRT66_13470 [Flavobacteriaceae bacterium]|nr:hypothetical protein [Flavobacteriaceae bacterium]